LNRTLKQFSCVTVMVGPEGFEPSLHSASLRSGKPVGLDQQVLSNLASFAWWMQKKPYREATIRGTLTCLKSIARQSALDNPESVKEYIARAKVSENRKCILVDAVARYYDYKQIQFQKPIYRKIQRLPFIPQEREVDDLISGVGKKTATFLQLLKESALRPGEAWALRWIDLDFEGHCLTCTPEKNSNSRQLKMSNRLISMLNALPKESNWVFHTNEASPLDSLIRFRRMFERQRSRLADKLQNPRLSQVTFKTLRHFKATMFYHQTKDILATMQLLGHKNIRNTLVYTHLVNFESDDYVCKVAKTVEEAKALVESGFDYVTEVDANKLFRKRK
jgi:integrase